MYTSEGFIPQRYGIGLVLPFGLKSSLVNTDEMWNRQRNESVYTSEGFIPQQYGIGLVLPFGLKSSLVNTDEMWIR
ncbi:MAG: hypothetical protein ABJR05_03785 [Balneola sp.]